jgi:hypothetical protein
MVRTVVTHPLRISSMGIHAPGRTRSNSLFQRLTPEQFRQRYSSRWGPDALATLTDPKVGCSSRLG